MYPLQIRVDYYTDKKDRKKKTLDKKFFKKLNELKRDVLKST